MRVEQDTWIAARCGIGDGLLHHDTWQRPVGAHTSPVYVARGDAYARNDLAALAHMRALVEGCLAYIRDRAPLGAPGRLSHRHGEPDHLAYLTRPLHQALAALDDRTTQR